MQHPPSFSFAPGCALLGYVALEAPFMAMAGVYLSEFTGGAFSYIAPSSRLSHTRVGRYCSIGDLVATLSQHPAHALTTSPITYNSTFPPPFDSKPKFNYPEWQKTTIGNDVWIGTNVLIKGGVNITAAKISPNQRSTTV